MEPFEGNGVFWRVEHPEDRLAGHFTYDPKMGAALELIGIFGGLGGIEEVFGPPVSRTLCGLIPGKTLVILHAIQNGVTVGSETDSERYKAPLVLEGADWERLGRPCFDEVEVELDLLPAWVGSPRFELDRESNTDGSTQIVRISLQPRDREQANDAGLQLSLESRWGATQGGLEHAELTQQFVLTATYAGERDIEAVLEDVAHIQNLITIAMDSPCAPTRVTGFRRDLRRNVGDEDYPQPIEVCATRRYSPPEDADTPRVMMGYDALGGLLTVIRWIQSARRLRPVTGGLLSIRYTPHMFVENRYDNVIGAAETFDRLLFDNHIRPPDEFRAQVEAVTDVIPIEHREWAQGAFAHGNEPRLRHRLVRMCRHVEPLMTELVGDVDRWAHVVATLRNRLTHHDDSVTFEWEPADAFFLGDSVYLLVAACLLIECGVDTQVMMAIFRSSRVSHLRTVLQSVIERLALQIH